MVHSFTVLAGLIALLPVAFASPLAGRALDTSWHCNQYDAIVAGQYTMYTDAWGKNNAKSGSNCAAIKSLSGTTIAWQNNWSWTANANTGVKSFANINLNSGINVQLSTISSIPSTWKWSQSNTANEVADVAYDIFTSNTSGGSDANEIMIWLANINAGPISYNYNADGSAKPVATGISLGGHTWTVYHGNNGANEVYSFLPSSMITSFSADLNLFLKYLTGKGYFATSQYLTKVQAGTEATSGQADFITSSYTVTVKS